MEPNKINYRDLYPFDKEQIYHITNHIKESGERFFYNETISCSSIELCSFLQKALSKYDEKEFCKIIAINTITEILESYPTINYIYQFNKMQNEIDKTLIGIHKVNGNRAKLQDQLPFIINTCRLIVNLFNEDELYFFLSKILPDTKQDKCDKFRNIVLNGNDFRIYQIVNRLSKDSLPESFAHGNFKDKISDIDLHHMSTVMSDGHVITKSEHVDNITQSYLSFLILKYFVEHELHSEYYIYTQEVKRYGIAASMLIDGKQDIGLLFTTYHLYKDNVYINDFFRYVLNVKIGSEDLNEILKYLSHRHISKYIESEYKTKQEQESFDEIAFLEDEPIVPEYHLNKLEHINEQNVSVLYKALKDKQYISKSTDINDFKYVFGIGERRDDFKPIEWLGMYNGKPGRNQILYLLGAMDYPIEEIKCANGRKIISECFSFSVETRKGGYEPKDFPKGQYPIPAKSVKKDLDSCLTKAGIEITIW